jgi:hypothetical protein
VFNGYTVTKEKKVVGVFVRFFVRHFSVRIQGDTDASKSDMEDGQLVARGLDVVEGATCDTLS